jgi:hypothetical protein
MEDTQMHACAALFTLALYCTARKVVASASGSASGSARASAEEAGTNALISTTHVVVRFLHEAPQLFWRWFRETLSSSAALVMCARPFTVLH